MRQKRKRIDLFLILILIFVGRSLVTAQEPVQANIVEMQVPGQVTLDVKDVDIRDVARVFSRISGLNIVISDDVKAKVTFRATDVDWETALNIILKTYNLTAQREGNFLRIITYEKLRREEDGVPLVTKVVFLNFSKAEELVRALDSLRSSRGRIDTDKTTNSLIITDTSDRIEKMLLVIEELDKRTPQVMIEAMMVDVKLTDQEQLGINWAITGKDRPERSFTQTLLTSRTEGIIRYGKTILPHANFTALIDFWAQNKKAEILANPKVLTLDGREASIELTDEIPYLSSSISSGNTSVITTTASFRESGIKLYVTPHISVGGFISLSIRTEQSFQSGTVTTTTGAQPVIDSRKAETNLLVRDAETIVIGGLRKKDTTSTIDKIPILGDIPFLGRAFRREVEQVMNTELLIFVTPYIYTEAKLSPQEKRSLEKMESLKKSTTQEEKKESLPFGLRPTK